MGEMLRCNQRGRVQWWLKNSAPVSRLQTRSVCGYSRRAVKNVINAPAIKALGDFMITGGCLCGAVRYTLSEGPIIGRVCWCRTCQKLGAGGPAVGAAFKTAALTVTGELRDYASIADSGNRM